MAVLSLMLALLTLTSILMLGNGQDCANRLSCGDCIGTAGCSWCATVNFQGTRCLSNTSSEACNDIQTSTGNVNDITRSDVNSDPVSVTNVNLQLSVGVPQSFRVTVTPLRNLPLDLYVLIDLSSSMSDEFSALRDAAGQIATQIRNVTNNIRIGFGSFNDKVTRPFTYFPVPDSTGFCMTDDSGELCRPNYAFRHLITLTDNITFYNMSLQDVSTTLNADLPENGLEGLAQVVACERIIGWRNRSAAGMERGLTRIVLFMTDDGFHYAGEGRLAGILTPYTGECLLDSTPTSPGPNGFTEFTGWRDVDYPSVGQIVQMLQQKEVAVIFAVTRARNETFQNLANLINLHSRASVAELQSNATSILNLVDTEYRRFLQAVALVPDDSTELDITIQPMCPQGTIELNGRSGCDRVELDTPVVFEVNITLRSCENFLTPGVYRTHRIQSPTFGDFIVNYTGDCVCDCARNLMRPNPVAACNFNGDFVCGVCECFDGWCGDDCSLKVGELCDCDRLTDTCPRGPPPRLNVPGPLCYGQGACCEGTCICRQNDRGYFYRHGSNQMDCSCPPEEDVCRRVPFDLATTTCVNGVCGCEGCECQNRFFGRVCDARDVGSCNDAMDLECIRMCVESGFNEDACKNCETTRPIVTIDVVPSDNLVETLQRIANNTFRNQSFTYELDCSAVISPCTYDYFLLRGQEMYVLILGRSADCVETGGIRLPFEPWVLAIIVVGALLILGIVLFVLIRVIFSILDYLEVKRWERETKDADFSKNQNPLYQSPEMKYENVAYGRE